MPPVSSRRILGLSLAIYLPMMATGVWVEPPGGFRPNSLAHFALGIAMAGALGALTVAASRWTTRHTAWGRALALEFSTLLEGIDSRTVLALALLSAFGEEMLFRGVLHPRLGLLPTALLFAALHFPYRRAMWPWTAFALVAGILLAGLTEFSGALWPAILLHFIINYFNLHDLVESSEDSGAPPHTGPQPPGPQPPSPPPL